MDKPKKQPTSAAQTGQSETADEAKSAAKKTTKAKAAAPAETPSPKAAKKGAKAPVAKKPQPAAGSPVVDTGLAAATAARMLAHRAVAGAPAPAQPTADAPTSTGGKESSAFQKLKNNLTNPVAGLSNVLGGPINEKKSHSTFNSNQQINRSQGFGGGGNRLGVPRRTSGG